MGTAGGEVEVVMTMEVVGGAGVSADQGRWRERLRGWEPSEAEVAGGGSDSEGRSPRSRRWLAARRRVQAESVAGASPRWTEASLAPRS